MLTSFRQGSSAANGGFDAELSISVKNIIGIVRRNAVLIASIVVGALIAGGVITLLITPKYEAVTKILIEDQPDQIIEGADLQRAVSVSDTERFLETQIGIMQSRALARDVVRQVHLADDVAFYAAFGSAMPTEASEPGQKLADYREKAAIDLLLQGLMISIPPDSRIAELRIISRDPTLSARLANTYGERFIAYSLNQKYESSSYARKYLVEQLQDAREKLSQSERDGNQYARAAGLIHTGGDLASGQTDSTLSVTNNKLIQLTAAAAEATVERIAAEDRWNVVSRQTPLAIPEVNANSAVMQLVAAKAKAQAELADQLSTHLDGYTTVKAKRAEIQELDSRINAMASELKISVKLIYDTAAKKEQSLLAQVNQLRGEALDEQDRGVQYSILRRVADTNRTLYASLLSRYNQLSASAGASANNVTIVDQAVVPTVRISPNLTLNLLLSFVVGLLCAGVVVGLKELLDDSISSPEDVEHKLGLPLLGLMPRREADKIGRELTDQRSVVVEAFRSLVTNLSYSTPNGLPQVLLITSANEGEGKSTTASAIASDIAGLGKRTLLVDADLRRPTLHRRVADRESRGLPDVLTGKCDMGDVVQSVPDMPTLFYLTALPIPPDPAVILAGANVGRFIEQARRQFDVIILDCPPLLGLSDVPLLVNHADGVLMVIDASNFHRGAVKSALRRLGMVKAKILGVVLNRFSPKAGSDEYSYYGYSYYSYGKGED